MKRHITKIFFAICLTFFLNACSSTQTQSGWDQFLSFFGAQEEINPDSLEFLEAVSGTKLLMINAPTIKFYDLAVVRVTYYAINIDLFQTGVPIGTLEITKNNVCFQGECAPKSLAAKKIFGTVSYGDLFDDIFLNNDIFNKKGLRIDKNGTLTQRFLLNNQEILYQRGADFTVFKNLTTGVVISIQDYVLPNFTPPNPRQR